MQRVKLAIAKRSLLKSRAESNAIVGLLNPGARIPVEAVAGLEVVQREFTRQTTWNQLQAWKMLPAILMEWAVILSCFTIALAIPNPIVWLGLAFVIGTRQTALQSFAKMAVYRGLSTHPRINEGLGNWLCAYPLFFSTESLRQRIVLFYSPSNETKRCVFTNFGHYMFGFAILGLIIGLNLGLAVIALWVLPRVLVMPLLSKLKG